MAESTEIEYRRAYADHSAAVFRFLLAWTNEWSAAEDLTQETYLRLWKHRAKVRWDEPIVPWLLVTARRLAHNRFRSVRRAFNSSPPVEGWDESVRARWLDVQKAFGMLTALERSALFLTAIEGWSYAEVAGVLGTTDGALRAAVSRARDKLERA